MGTTFLTTGLYFAPLISHTVYTESYIGETPTFPFNSSTCSNNVSGLDFTKANHVRLMTSAKNSDASEGSNTKSLFKPTGLDFSESASGIRNASMACLRKLGTSLDFGSSPGLEMTGATLPENSAPNDS